MKRAFSYIRFSSLKQKKGRSLTRQTVSAEQWCLDNGYTLDDSLSLRDLGVSAFKGKNHRQGALAGFLEAVELGKVPQGSVLLVESLDRLTREQISDALTLFLGILNAGITIVTLLDPVRTYTKASTADIAGLLEPLVEMERAYKESLVKSERSKDNWKGKRGNLKYKPMTRTLPGWLAVKNNKIEAIPDKASTVRQIYEWAAAGDGIGRICKRLNQTNIPPIGKKKDFWHRSYVAKILANRETMGEFQPHAVQNGKRQPQGDPVLDYYPAVVSPDLFYQAQQGKANRSLYQGHKGDGTTNLFAGLLFDARDASPMRTMNKGTKSNGRFLVSQAADRGQPGSTFKSFPYDLVETAIFEFLKELRPEDVLAKRHQTDHDQDIARLSGHLQNIDYKINKVKERIRNEDDVDALLDLLKSLQTDKKDTADALELATAAKHDRQTETLGETQTIMQLHQTATGEARINLRRKIKARLPGIVKEIWLVAWDERMPKGRLKDTMAELQIFLNNGTHRSIFISKKQRQAISPTDAMHYMIESDDLRRYRNPETGLWYDKRHPWAAGRRKENYRQQQA